MAVVIALDADPRAAAVAQLLALPLITPEIRRFPDGELYARIDADLTGHDAILVGSLTRPAETFMLIAFLAATARELGARRVGLVAPYLAYMRQDVAFHRGEAIAARHFGKLISATVDWLVTVDPHLHRIHTLDGLYSIPTTIARAAPDIAAWITREISHPILVGPDAESVQWVSAVAEACGAPFLILEKTRRGDRDVSISSPTRPFDGATPVLIDDIVSTGRTLIEATKQLRAAGATAPMCVAIHAVFADALEPVLVAAGAQGIVTCNTIVHGSNRISVDAAIAEATRGHL